MSYVLDANDIDPCDRVDAIKTMLGEAWATDVQFDRGAHDIRFKIEVDQVGPLTVVRTHSNGLHLQLVPARVPSDSAPALAVQLHDGATSHFEQDGRRYALCKNDMVLNDLSAPYSFYWSGWARTSAVVVDLDRLALPVDTVRDAIRASIPATSLSRLTLKHLQHVTAEMDTFAVDASAEIVWQTTAQLLRALVSQAVGRPALHAQTWHDSELARVLEYARQNLGNPNLSGAVIAHAQHMSERQLFRVCRQAGLSLADWIMQRRLEGTRTDLADRTLMHLTVSQIATRWGFASPSHFSQRFRREYGTTPAEWRRLHGGKYSG